MNIIDTSKPWYYLPIQWKNFDDMSGFTPPPVNAPAPEQTVPQELPKPEIQLDTAKTQWYLEIPKAITAIQYVGNNLQNMEEFCNNGRYRLVSMEDGTLKLSDSESSVIINPGDYVASLKSGFSVYKADEFIKNYQYIEKDSDASLTNPAVADPSITGLPPTGMSPMDGAPMQFNKFNNLISTVNQATNAARGNLMLANQVNKHFIKSKTLGENISGAANILRAAKAPIETADVLSKASQGESTNKLANIGENIDNVLAQKSQRASQFSTFNFAKKPEKTGITGSGLREKFDTYASYVGLDPDPDKRKVQAQQVAADKIGEGAGALVANVGNFFRGVQNPNFSFLEHKPVSDMAGIVVHVMKKHGMCHDRMNDFENITPHGDISPINGNVGVDTIDEIRDEFKVLLDKPIPKQELGSNTKSQTQIFDTREEL